MKKSVPMLAALREGWQITLNNFSALLLLLLIVVATRVVYGISQALIVSIAPGGEAQGGLRTLHSIGTTLIDYWLTIGGYRMMIDAARAGKVRIGLLFTGLPWMLRQIGINILLALATLVTMIPCILAVAALWYLQGPALAEVYQVTGLNPLLDFIRDYELFILSGLVAIAILILPPMIVGAYLSFSLFALVDKNTGVIDSMWVSWRVARGALFQLVNFMLLCGLVVIAGFLAFFVGLLFAIPVSTFAFAVVYRELLRQTEAREGILVQPGVLSLAPQQEAI